MPRTWRVRPHDESLVRRLSGELSVSPLVAQVLLSRGFHTGAQAREFLDPRLLDLHDPAELPGVAEAADRIVSAARAGRRITIYGDYDVDGVTATAVLYHCLELAGAEVDYYIPSRLEEGYGLNCEAIRKLQEEDPSRLVISVDCGIASVQEAALARELGLELIVTDHHEFGAELPEADVLVHPRLPGHEYPFGELCGVGVAFKLAWAVSQRLNDGRKASPRMKEYLLSAIGLTAIGTVADVVPLFGENRIIVRYGLESLAKRSPVGLRALVELAGIEHDGALSAEDVGFGIGPRINAAGRLGQARLAVELLVTEDETRARKLAGYLDELNQSRKKVERRILRQAREMVKANPDWEDHGGLVLAHPDWHPGVIGIVASRVAEQFEKPAILVALDEKTGLGQGSGRSFAGYDLHAGLTACAGHLQTFGGHRAAAGLRIAADDVAAFREAFAAHARQNYVAERDHLRIDAEVRLKDVTLRAVRELDRLGPFGAENPRPVFASSVELAEPPRTVGEGGNHLQLRVRQNGATIKAIAFGRGDWADEIRQAGDRIAISFAPGVNLFRGYHNVELQLKDWQPEDA